MTERPFSLLTKAERRASDALFTAEDFLRHYENRFSSRFRWTGGPEGMPEDFPERMIWHFGLLGTAKAFGKVQLCGGQASLKGIYGQPLSFFPSSGNSSVVPDGWGTAHEGPVLWMPSVPERDVEPYCAMMAHAWRAMRSNISGMVQPVIVQGTAGSELNARECGQAVDGFAPTIYTLDRSAVEAKVLNLGASDHTESLIKVINDLDCEILARLGIKSAGTEKASGVTAEETLSITQELRLQLEADLEKRRRFCEEVRDILPGLTVEPAPGLMDAPKSTIDEDGEDGDERDGDGGDEDGPADGERLRRAHLPGRPAHRGRERRARRAAPRGPRLRAAHVRPHRPHLGEACGPDRRGRPRRPGDL